jgi:hypothetical protein
MVQRSELPGPGASRSPGRRPNRFRVSLANALPGGTEVPDGGFQGESRKTPGGDQAGSAGAPREPKR